MIVHFIGGPRDGEREALSELRSERLMFPIAPPIHHYVRDEVPPSLIGHIETAEYRVIRRERYAIAEFVEPRITTRWAVTVKVRDRYATDAVVDFHDWLVKCSREFGAGAGPRKDVRCGAWQMRGADVAELDFLVIGDGPPDPAGVAVAAAKLQRWLDAELPKGVYVTETQAATGD